MRLIRLLPCSGLVAGLLAFASGAHAATQPSAEAWLAHYYQQPAPDRVAPAIFELSRSGYFEQPGHVSLAIGFLASIFAQHPERVNEWMSVSRVLPVAHQRLLASALWYSGHPRGATELRALARSAAPEVRRELDAMLRSAAPSLAQADVRSEQSLNLQWGAFLATGEQAPVRHILAALGSTDNSQLSQNVRWSLAQNAAQHERVLAICRDELARQPNAVRETLRAVINETEARHAPSI